MILKDNFYRIEQTQANLEYGEFRVRLLPDYDIYEGHFPGRPVCPGVCLMGMIRECGEIVTGHALLLSHVLRCRFLAVTTPTTTPLLTVVVRLNHDSAQQLILEGEVLDDTTTYVKLKAVVTAAMIQKT